VAACLLTLLLCSARAALGDVVGIAASKDNTLYSESGSLSNGAGQHFFAGRNNIGDTRRGPIAFDVAASIPAGSTVTSVSLRLHMSRTNLLVTGVQPVALHRVLADWGEGTSDADGLFGEGSGAPATLGDATWIYRFFNTVLWGAPGGDFVATPSAAIQIGGIGLYTWGSTPDMLADVQAWLDDPKSNFGWILLSNEATFPTSKRFDSRQNPDVSLRPALTVEFTAPVDLGGQVPDGARVPGTPLTIERGAGGQITLRWGPSCLSTDTDYEVYEGVLRDFASHAPRACSTGGATSFTLTPAPAGVYYLVVPHSTVREGSYGTNSRGDSRPPSLSACLPQAALVCQ